MSPDPAVPALTGLAQLAVFVRDLDRALTFYRDVLGLPFLFRGGPESNPMAFFDCGGVRLLLGPAHKPEFEPPGSVLYFRTADIHASAKAIEGRGVTFDQQPHLVAKLPDREIWIAEFSDLEGNALALMGEVPLES